MTDRWLLKTEPNVYSLDDLETEVDKTTLWDGVRNYQARNFLRDQIQVGHLALWYHSNDKPPHVAGIVEVVRSGYPDPSQFNKRSKYFDPKATKDNPIWFCVDVRFVERFTRPLPLQMLRDDTALDGLELNRKGSRLSVQPVSRTHFNRVCTLGRKT